MATRTKSFFDQDHRRPRPGQPRPGQWNTHHHSGQPRPGQWNKHHHPGQPPRDAPAHVPVPAAIPATSQAKSKLKAFEFTPEANRAAASAAAGDGNGSTSPCTPGAHLPFEDLIGNVDEVTNDEPVPRSPEEQIGWMPTSSSDALTPTRKKRRRAKSSSPAALASSSQPHTASAQRSAPPALKTPAADPAADLWQRYANGKQTGDASKLPEISTLLFHPSPRPLETPVKNGKLRRWASTGNDWPTSKNKRRCTNSRTSVNVWQDQTAIESGGRSKVATMVQKMQETLASQRQEQAQDETPVINPTMDVPSSSSPLPDARVESGSKIGNTTPLRTRRPLVPVQALRPPAAPAEHIQSKPRPQMQRTQSGGVRYDPSRVAGDPLDPGAAPTYTLQSKAPLPAYKRPSVTRLPGQPKVPQVALPPPPKKGQSEFDDDDFDLTADDLDELCSQVPLGQRSLHDIPPYPIPPPQSQPAVINAPGRPPVQQPAIIMDDDDDDDDEFGGGEIDEASLAQAEFSATQAYRKSPRKRSPRKSPRKSHHRAAPSTRSPLVSATPRLQRFVVRHVADEQFTNEKGRSIMQRLLVAESERTKATAQITLRGSWLETPVSPKTIIHIARLQREHAGTQANGSTRYRQILVSDAQDSPFLVVHPDHMLSATTVADSFDCVRKAVLQDRIKATGMTSKAMVYGKILHEIFQQCLSANQWDENFLDGIVERTVQVHVEGLWELGMRDSVLAVEEIKAKMGEISAWASVFIKSEPSAGSTVDDRQGEKVFMSISKLIAIEEHIWSPRYGLKGNIDATVQATTTSRPGAPDLRKLIVPFEVKTGRTTHSAAHRAQTALYTLLLSDRYDVEVEAGILYYLETSSMSRIAPPFNEIKQMLQQRNRLAEFIFRARYPTQKDDDATDIRPPAASQAIEESGMPTLLRNPSKCGRCYAQQSCFVYHALVEGGTSQSAGMVDDNRKSHSLTWNEAIGHLTLEGKCEKDMRNAKILKDWFTKWDKLLTFEESDQSRLMKELWTMSSSEREAAGRCFGHLVLARDLTNTSVTTQATVDGIEGSGGRINRYAYSFMRSTSSQMSNFNEGSQLTVGEPVVVSSEQCQWALAKGYITKVTRSEVAVAVDRKLGNSRMREADFHEVNNQVFRGSMPAGGMDPSEIGLTCKRGSQMLYRLDKDEFSNGLALVRNNLVRLMSSDPMHKKLRDQIIFNEAPDVPGLSALPEQDLTGSGPATQLGSINEDQHRAVRAVLSAKDYALILGMPGTGKTTTIAHIIHALVAERKSILLTSFTHTAVDNILLKIKDVVPKNSVLRLGSPAKIQDQVQEFCQLAAAPRKSIDEVDAAFMGTQIVATTCMGTNHALFNRRSFDVCIVDEASQITLPTILGPLLHARRFVLVGDHHQLPPLVQNKAALAGGLDVSLFRQLCESHPAAVTDLGRQYRMCEDIMSLSNELIYHGKLRCGNERVAHRTLPASDGKTLDVYHRPSSCAGLASLCWLHRVTEPRRKVVFANTSPLGKSALETLSGGGKITNHVEATLTAQAVLALLARGVPAPEIGVIALYRSQLSLLRQLFRRARIPSTVEIDSADRFQGRDKECIIISMVRSNEVGMVGDLLKDSRRVNVALTRARSKLIVFGNRNTLQRNELLGKLLDMMDQRRWAFDVPPHADESHCFDFSTQVAEDIVVQQSPSPSPATTTTTTTTTTKELKRTSPSKLQSPCRRRSPTKRIKGSKAVKWAAAQEALTIDLTRDD